MEDIIRYYQQNKYEFWKECLLGYEEEKEYLYDEWIEDYFKSSTIENGCQIFSLISRLRLGETNHVIINYMSCLFPTYHNQNNYNK